VYGLDFTNMELEDIEHVQKHFQKVQEMEAPKYLRGLARNRLREIAFEIGMLGKYGLDINDPKSGLVLRSLPWMELDIDLTQVNKMAEKKYRT